MSDDLFLLMILGILGGVIDLIGDKMRHRFVQLLGISMEIVAGALLSLTVLYQIINLST